MPCNSQETTLSLVPKRILIADDHLAVREGLRSLIDPDPDFKVVGEAADGIEAARKALELRPDLIMLDNSMPGMTGLEVARMLRDNLPATKIVFLTLDPGIRDLALATGAAAHISKDQPPQEIMRVVRAAAGISTPKPQVNQPMSAQAKLAELLISEKLLTSRQIQDLDRSREGKQTLSNAVLRSSLVAADALANALARITGHPVVSLRSAPEPAVIRQLPRRFCELRAVVLIEFGRASATLAMADPLDEAAAREAKDMLGDIDLKVVTATLTEVRDAIHHAHAPALVPLVAVPPLPERRSRRPLALVAALAAALLLIATGTGVVLNQATVVAARANLTIFQGTVEVRHGSGNFAAASTNDLVEQGDTIRTASGGHAALTFFDRSLVVLEPDTQVVLETLRTVAGGRDIDLVLRQVTGKTWHVVAHSIGEGGRYAVLTPTSMNTVQGTAFQVRIDALGRTVISTTDGTVRTFGTDTAIPPVLVAAGMQSTVTQTGPSAAAPITDATLTFTFEDANQAFVVNAAGQAAGTKEGVVLRYIPGSSIAQDNGRVVVTIPGSDAGRFSSIVAPKG
ncbi:MAG: response regulator, partial [Chloroflexi bacterium]